VSGAGKSSLLRAGVLPRAGELTPDGALWPHLVLTPARSPLSELAAHTAGRTGKDAATLRQTLRDDPAGPITIPNDSDGAYAVAFSPDGKTLATADPAKSGKLTSHPHHFCRYAQQVRC
jgi:hypothetical protein